MKKILVTIVATVCAMAMLVACGGSKPAATTAAPAAPAAPAEGETQAAAKEEHKAITIKLQGAFAEGADHYWYFEEFCKKVNEYSDGSVTVVWGAGPEAIPRDQLAEAMQNGIVELVYSPTAFLQTVNQGFGAVKLVDAYACRDNGGFELINQISQESLNSVFLGRCAVNSNFILTTQKEIKTMDDFKGMVFRGTAATRAFIEALGAEVVDMGWADVYSAIDKNVVHGVAGTYRDFVDNDLGGKCKYIIHPAFYNSDSSLFMTNAAWEKLDAFQQEAFMKAAQDWENESADYNTENNQKDIDTLVAAGSVVIELECGEEYYDLAYSSCWADLEKKVPELAAKFAELDK